MNEKREVILPSDFSGEKGKIVCYRISSYLELLYIDIRSRRIPCTKYFILQALL